MIKKSKGTHWVSLFIDINTAAYFDLFQIEYITQKVLKKKKKKKKSKINLSLTIYLEYKMMILLCVDFIVSLLYNIYLQEKLRWTTRIYFLQMTIKRKTR